MPERLKPPTDTLTIPAGEALTFEAPGACVRRPSSKGATFTISLDPKDPEQAQAIRMLDRLWKPCPFGGISTDDLAAMLPEDATHGRNDLYGGGRYSVHWFDGEAHVWRDQDRREALIAALLYMKPKETP